MRSLIILLMLAASAVAQIKPMHASGSFDVKLTPQTDPNTPQGFGRYTLDKQFHGDLEGTSVGQMLSAMTEVKGSGAYVALEKVTGKLAGKSGTFILQHKGVMTKNASMLSLSVVPDSGTGELTGLRGEMNIDIKEGKHFYTFDYRFDTEDK